MTEVTTDQEQDALDEVVPTLPDDAMPDDDPVIEE